MSYYTERKMITREKRLSTISHFNGTFEQLKNESSGNEIKQKIRTFSQINEDEITSAIGALASIKHAAVIVHGVAGCATSNLYFNAEGDSTVYSTNLQEKDTILGSDAKLHKAISKIVEEVNPKVVFIIGTPVVAINNDDVNSVIYELEDEFNIKIIYIYTDGFKTKSSYTGLDIVAHSILRNLIERPDDDEKSDFLNIITFSESKKVSAASPRFWISLILNTICCRDFLLLKELKMREPQKQVLYFPRMKVLSLPRNWKKTLE